MDHTLIIPTKNRPLTIDVALKCLNEFTYKGKVAILDGSNESTYFINKKTVDKFKDKLNIEIYKEKSFSEFSHKNMNPSKYDFFKNKIKTNYWTMMADDDCFFPNFAEYGISFLEKHHDYSAITGIEVNNYMDNNFQIIKSFAKVYPEFLEEDPLDRILKYSTAQNQTLPIFGVCRTNIMDELFDFERNFNFKPFCRESIEGLYSYDAEMPWQIHILSCGKVKVSSNKLMNFRNRHNSQERSTNLRFSQKNFLEYMGPLELIRNKSLGDFVKEHTLELEHLIKDKTKYDKITFERSISRIIWKFISRDSGAGLNTEKTDYNIYLNNYKKSFRIFCLNLPKLNSLFSPYFKNQIINKVLQIYLKLKINILVKKEILFYKNLIKKLNKTIKRKVGHNL